MDLRLVTIPFSHYCEKARWALDRAGLAYREDPHLPLISMVVARRAGGGKMVPVLITPDGPVTDSTDIVAWCDAHGDALPLFPPGPLGDEVRALEDDFDERLGPATRRLAYAAVLPARAASESLFDSAPKWEARVVSTMFPLVRGVMSRRLRLDPASLARSRMIVDEIFASVGARVADGRRYLVGDRFTAADLAFAALAAPVLAPDRYGAPLPPRETWPAEWRTYVDAMRATPAGKFALRLYDERAPAAR
jgi:glutathione S-transferase